jgi:hypothetical protein
MRFSGNLTVTVPSSPLWSFAGSHFGAVLHFQRSPERRSRARGPFAASRMRTCDARLLRGAWGTVSCASGRPKMRTSEGRPGSPFSPAWGSAIPATSVGVAETAGHSCVAGAACALAGEAVAFGRAGAALALGHPGAFWGLLRPSPRASCRQGPGRLAGGSVDPEPARWRRDRHRAASVADRNLKIITRRRARWRGDNHGRSAEGPG